MLGERRLVAVFLALPGTLLAACGSPPSGGAGEVQAAAQLVRVPDGTADLEYDAGSRLLTVTVHATGMMAGEELVARIRQGGCGSSAGDVLATLGSAVADVHGAIDASARVPDVDAVPSGAALEYLPPTAVAGTAPTALLCGDLSGRTGTMRLAAGTPSSPGGTVSLALDSGARTLSVRLVIQGLAPGTAHPAGIHDGSCAAQGPLAHALPTLWADGQGRAELHAEVGGVTRIGRWYVSILRGPGRAGPGATPLSCGDVAPSS
ncbi:MAG TPA: hypothetical protein VF112_02945 [Candidatus Dormibacteraeota bacterium]